MFRNHTLARMDPGDLAGLLPHMSERQVRRGETLIHQGGDVETVAFPTSALLSNTITFSDGRAAETFTTGVEGVSGLAPFLARARCAWAVEVKGSGGVWEMTAGSLRRATEGSPRLHLQLLRLANDYQVQASFAVACSALHPGLGRLALLLLRCSDQAATEELSFTQDDIALMLGFQRTTVNALAKELRKAGAIDYRRARICITDRDELRRHACECHALASLPAH